MSNMKYHFYLVLVLLSVLLLCCISASSGYNNDSIHITLNNTGSKNLADASVQLGKHMVSSGLLKAGGQATHLNYDYPVTEHTTVTLIYRDGRVVKKEVVLLENNILKKADEISVIFRINTDTDNITVDVYKGFQIQ